MRLVFHLRHFHWALSILPVILLRLYHFKRERRMFVCSPWAQSIEISIRVWNDKTSSLDIDIKGWIHDVQRARWHIVPKWYWESVCWDSSTDIEWIVDRDMPQWEMATTRDAWDMYVSSPVRDMHDIPRSLPSWLFCAQERERRAQVKSENSSDLDASHGLQPLTSNPPVPFIFCVILSSAQRCMYLRILRLPLFYSPH